MNQPSGAEVRRRRQHGEAEHLLEQLADTNDAGVETADVDRGCGQDLVAGVEQNEAQVFLLQALTLAMSILPEEIPVAFTTFICPNAVLKRASHCEPPLPVP